MKPWITLPLAAVLLNAALLATPAQACPGCKDSIGGDTATTGGGDATTPSGLPGGFNTSVYLMLGGVFGTMGLVGWVVVKGIRTPSARPGGFPVEKRIPPHTDEKQVRA
jgi:hypothetical protein